MNRNYDRPTVSKDWADSRHTEMPVAMAIHAIASGKRSADDIWEAPTSAEWDHVEMAVTEYVAHGDFEYDVHGYAWGQLTVRIAKP